jgi:hypothetical protein
MGAGISSGCAQGIPVSTPPVVVDARNIQQAARCFDSNLREQFPPHQCQFSSSNHISCLSDQLQPAKPTAMTFQDRHQIADFAVYCQLDHQCSP